MFIKNPEFRISAVSPKQYPDDGLPQVVLVGKSNVGKSSFINTLVNRKKLARTSSEPGKTRQINFYNMDEKFYLVDLPGYGFSKMSKQEQANVGTFIEEYLQKSKNIALIVFLIDIRHDPTANDKLMYDYIFKTNLPCIVIANKADKIAITKVDDAVIKFTKYFKSIKRYCISSIFQWEKNIYRQSLGRNRKIYIVKKSTRYDIFCRFSLTIYS